MVPKTLTLAATLAAVSLSAHPALSNDVRVLESTDRGIVVEIVTDSFTVEPVVHGGAEFVRVAAPGCDWTTEPGLPRLPVRGVLLGVPFGSDARLEVVTVESERLGETAVEPAPRESFARDGEFVIPLQEFETDDAFYRAGDSHPAGVAALGFDAVLRHQRTVQVLFHPFHYGPRDGLVVNRRIVVRLALTPGARTDDVVPAPVGEREWDGIYAGTVLNHREAREWRMRPAPRAVRGRAARRSEAYRFDVGETGIHRLDFSALQSAGLSTTPSVDDVAVYKRSFDRAAPDPFVETPLQVVVVDANSDGHFNGSDHILFYARSFLDEFLVEGWEDRHATRNAYWFAVDPSLAARMDARPGWHDWTGVTPPASFPDTLRYEQDVYFDPSPPSDVVDFYTWTSYLSQNDDYQLPFSVFDIDPAGDVVLRARYHGNASGLHTVDFSIVNGASQQNAVGSFQFAGITYTMGAAIYTSGPVPATHFTDGPNHLRAVGNRTGGDLDWFSLAYLRRYAAVGGRLAFTSAGVVGDAQFEVTRFATPGIRVFDVSDPMRPVRLTLGAGSVVPDGGQYKLVVQDPVPRFKRYEAVADGSALPVANVTRRAPADLATREADLVVVAHPNFAAAVEPLLARRESQGHAVARASVNDVYDEFGGGMPSPDAIRAYLRYAFEEWSRPPQFALLVGDASEDARNVTSSSAPNYVPTYVHVSVQNSDLVGSDTWYGCFSAVSPYLPQVYVGRLPVGSVGEANAIVSKILAYENYAAGDAWRKNVFFLADDLWSYVSLEDPYTRKGYEAGFTTICTGLAQIVAASPARIDTTVFAMRRYTDPYHGSNTSGDMSYLIATQNFVRGTVTPALIGRLSEGAVIVNFQGHGNKSLLTHESLLLKSDLPGIANDGKPFIFMGYSCQIGWFHYWSEGVTGDCIVEQMLLASSTRGASAVFASTGTEYLSTNEVMNRKVFEAFFQDPTPQGPPEQYYWPRWSLGGLLAKTIVKYVTGGRPSSPARTFCLLGDPLMRVEMSPPRFQVTVDGAPKLSGDYLLATGDVEVEIVANVIDEVEIDPATIAIVETDVGTIDPSEYTVRAMVDTLSQLSRWYRITYRAPIRHAAYDIRMSARDLNGQQTTFVLRVAEGARIEIRDVANHPNPFSASTKIIYLLSQSGSRVRVSVYTVGGRLIRDFKDAPNALSYNELEWDGRDAQGDEIANGVYLYVIEAEGDDGSKAVTPVGRMLKVR